MAAILVPVGELTHYCASPKCTADCTESHGKIQQESCAIAKITARCALYIGAPKIFGSSLPDYAHGYCYQRF